MEEKLIENFLKEQGIELNHTALIVYKDGYLRQPDIKYLLQEFYQFISIAKINSDNKLNSSCN